MRCVESGSAASSREESSGFGIRDRPRAFRAGCRDGEGRWWVESSSTEVEEEGVVGFGFGTAKRRKASRMERSVVAEILFSSARGEGWGGMAGVVVEEGGLRVEGRGCGGGEEEVRL